MRGSFRFDGIPYAGTIYANELTPIYLRGSLKSTPLKSQVENIGPESPSRSGKTTWLTGKARPGIGIAHVQISSEMYAMINIRTRIATLTFLVVFGTSALWAIDPPVLAAPATGATNQSIPLILSWIADPAATGYRVQLSTSLTFPASSMFLDTLLEAQSDDPTLFLPVSGLAHKTKYYWRVHTRQNADSSVWSSVRNFTTIVDTPAVPSLVAPVDNAGSQSVNPTTFSWGAVPDAASYRLQIATDPAFVSLVVNDSTLTGVSKQISGLAFGAEYYWRLGAKNVAGSSAYTAARRFTTRLAPPAIVSPANNATSIAITPLLSWSSIPGADSYRVQVSTATSFSTMVLNTTSLSESLNVGPLANKTKYYWRVSGRNERGDTSAYPTTAWNFTTIVSGASEPVLLAPADSAKSQPVSPTTFSWIAVPDAATYRLQVASDPAFTTLVFDDSSITTTSKQVAGLLTGSQYFWRVRAKNVAATSPFSPARVLTTRLLPPSIVAPATGALDQSVTPVLRWSSVPTAATYRVQVSKNTQFTALIASAFANAESLAVGPLGNDTLYYWRVSARNENGDSSIFPTSAWTFRTKIVAPLLNAPASGAIGQPVNPVLSWFSSPGGTSYRLQVSEDPTFPSTVVFDDAGIATTSRQVGPLNSSRTYYWRLNARNSAGTSTSLWSEIRSFTTRIDTPAAPSLLWPPEGTVDLGFTPLLQWNQSSGAAFYKIQVARDSLFAGVEFERTPIVGTSFQVGPLSGNTRFFWRVLATNASNTASSPYSPPWSFRTMLQTPPVPVLKDPASRSMAQSTTPTVRWSSSNATEWYRVQVSADSYFPTTVLDTTGVVDSALTLRRNLEHNTAYYWRVKGLNRLDSSSYTLPFNFTTRIADPVLLSPADGSGDHPATNISFSWAPVSGARTYLLRVALDTAFAAVVYSDSALVTNSARVNSLSVSTRYFWQVSARSDSNGITNSPIRQFSTVVTIPAVPQLVAPPPAATDLPPSVTFIWQPTLGASSYRLQVAADSLFGTVLYDFPTLTSTNHVVASLAYSATYYWRVSASNGNGPSAYSVIRRFTVTVPPPAVPLQIAPADGQTDLALPVMLTWGATAGATTYRVRISPTPDFVSVLYDTVTTEPRKSVGTIPYGSRFYWQVTALNAGGAQSSAVWSFTTRISIPTLPALSLPHNGTANTPLEVTLSWAGATGASAYHVQVSTDSMFALLIVNDSTIIQSSFQTGRLNGSTRYFWRVRSVNPSGASTYTAPWSFTTVIATPLPIAPASDMIDQPVTLRFVWTSVANAGTYRVQLSLDSLFTIRTFDDSTLVDSSRTISGLLRSSTYYWRVRARDAGGISTGSWSTVSRFTTVPDPPAMPVLAGPVSGAPNMPLTPVLSWQHAARAVRYRLQISEDSLFTLVMFEDSTLVDTSYKATLPDHFTRYHWRVQAENAGGGSPWSAGNTFLTVLATPQWISPAANAILQPLTLSIRWSASQGAERYRLILSPDSLLHTPVLDDSGITTTSRVVSGLAYLSVYYCRVQARTADGTSHSATSSILRFTTVVEPPPAPLLVVPVNTSEGEAAARALAWCAAARAVRYHIQVSTDSLFTLRLVNDSTLTDTTYNPPGLQAYTRHWWRVRSGNDGGWSAYSPAWSYTTSLATPVPVAPPDSAIDVDVAVTLRWTASPGATSYILELAKDPLFQVAVLRDSTIPANSLDLTGLEPFTAYYWRVKAIDAKGAGAYSTPRLFVTRLVPPPAPVQQTPGSGLASVPNTQMFRWKSSRLADGYQLQIATDSPFDSTIYDQSGIPDTVVTVSGLECDTRYFWRVRAWNSRGASVFSPVWSFTTVAAPPDIPVPVDPVSASSGQLPYIRFTWKTTPYARSYHLQVSLDAPFSSTVYNDSTLTDTVQRVGPLEYSRTYYWRLRAKNNDWTTQWSPVWSATVMSAPVLYDLFQNFPNPANPSTVIRYDLPAEAEVILTLHNLLGQKVRELVSMTQKAGRYEHTLDGSDLPSGVYFYRITARSLGSGSGQPAPPVDPFVLTRKMLILK